MRSRARGLHALTRIGLISIGVGGCSMALEHPAFVLPDRPMKFAAAGANSGHVAVVSIAAASWTSQRGGRPDPDSSRTDAEWLDRTLLEYLGRRGITVERSSRPAAPGFFDTTDAFELPALNLYGGGGYYGRVTFPSFYCVDDSALRDLRAREAWTEVLATLRAVRRRPEPIVRHADDLRRVLGADMLVIGVVSRRNLSTTKKAAQVAASTVVTLGTIPAFEPSNCHLHLYILDLGCGAFRWGDACRVNRADGLAAPEAWSRLLPRWP